MAVEGVGAVCPPWASTEPPDFSGGMAGRKLYANRGIVLQRSRLISQAEWRDGYDDVSHFLDGLQRSRLISQAEWLAGDSADPGLV